MIYIKSLIASIGNPIAFFTLLFGHGPGTFNNLGDNIQQISLFGLIVLVIFGYLYLGVCVMFRMLIKRKENIMDCFGEISRSLFPLSVGGVILPVLLLNGMEGNVFGFLICLPAVIFTLIWIVVSLYAICKSKRSISSNVD